MTDIELIKSKIDIVSFVSDYVSLKKAGRNFKANCPFHSEKTPSFIVSPERGTWHCFGACGEGGDAIKFLQKWENIDFLESLKILAKKTGVTLSNFTPTDESKKKDTYFQINHLASEFYHYLLTSHKLGKRALEYLKNRGIKDETIKTFSLGYAPESWDSLSKFLEKKSYQAFDIYTAGLTVKSESGKYYDRFRGRLIFTLKNHRGDIVGFSGRLLDEGVYSEREQGAKYINTSETPIYSKGNTLYGLDVTKEMIKKADGAIVVEGEFDMLSSFQTGVSNVVAIKGSTLTEGQTLLLKRFADQVSLALDTDLAGNAAAKRGIEIAEKAGLSVEIITISQGKDPADCISINPAIWKKEVKEGIPVYDFIINQAFKKYHGEDALSKKKISSEVVPFIAKIENPIVFSHYLRQIAKKLDVSEESIELAVKQFQKKQVMPIIEVSPVLKTLRNVLLEEYILALIIQTEKVEKSLSVVLKIVKEEDFNLPAAAKIIQLLQLYFKTHKEFDVKKFSSLLSPELSPLFDKVLLLDIENVLSDVSKYDKELMQTAKEIKKNSLRRNINSLSTKIKEKEDETDEKKVDQLQQELKNLLTQLREVDIEASRR